MDELQNLRGEIDRLDNELLALLIKRFELMTAIADYKRKHQLPVYDGARERELLERLGKKSQEKGLRQDIIEAVFQEIIHQSRRLQATRIEQDNL